MCHNCKKQNYVSNFNLFIAKFFEKIEIKFLLSNHSYLSHDKDFGVIEKRKQKMKTMIPEKIKNNILTASVRNTFKIVSMNSRFF